MIVKKLHGRGANGVAEIHGEILFGPGTELDRWKIRFQERIYAASVANAPTHDYGTRPLRPHPGKPLKASFMKSRPRTRITKGGGFFYAAVGNRKAYSALVELGTGIYNGRSAYPAKVLPPYAPGSPSLYEHTWKPGGRPVAPVMIKGQKGQHYMEEALNIAFRSMLGRAYQLPGEGVVGAGLKSRWLLTEEPAFPGNTVADAGFILDLQQWRQWRDEAWGEGKGLGEGRALTRYAVTRLRRINEHKQAKAATSAQRAEARRLRKNAAQNEKRRRERESNAAKGTTKPDFGARLSKKQAKEGRDLLSNAIAKYGSANVDRGSLELRNGRWYLLIRVRSKSDGRYAWEERSIRARS